jgi:hypothetical protein
VSRQIFYWLKIDGVINSHQPEIWPLPYLVVIGHVSLCHPLFSFLLTSDFDVLRQIGTSRIFDLKLAAVIS